VAAASAIMRADTAGGRSVADCVDSAADSADAGEGACAVEAGLDGAEASDVVESAAAGAEVGAAAAAAGAPPIAPTATVKSLALDSESPDPPSDPVPASAIDGAAVSPAPAEEPARPPIAEEPAVGAEAPPRRTEWPDPVFNLDSLAAGPDPAPAAGLLPAPAADPNLSGEVPSVARLSEGRDELDMGRQIDPGIEESTPESGFADAVPEPPAPAGAASWTGRATGSRISSTSTRAALASAKASPNVRSSAPPGMLIWPGIGPTPGPSVTFEDNPAMVNDLQERRRAGRTCPRSGANPRCT
jgi:hypothetical protein